MQEVSRLLHIPDEDNEVNAIALRIHVAIALEQHFAEIAGRAIIAQGDLLQTDIVTCRHLLVALLSAAVDAVDRTSSSVVVFETE